MTNLSFTMAAAALALVAISSARLGSTPIGRSFLAFAVSSAVWAIAHLAHTAEVLGAEGAELASRGAWLLAVGQLFRLACQAANDSTALSRPVEAMIWLPTAALFALGDPMLVAVWTSLLCATSAVRLRAVPVRSWDGFRIARDGTTGMLLLIAVIPLGWLAGIPEPTLGVITPLVVACLATGLRYGLPRMGLLSEGRVQHSRVIQAMNDGVLVVDLHGRLVDFNEAAGGILDLDASYRVARPVAEALADHPDLVELLSGAIDGRSVYSLEPRDGESEAHTYDLRLSALYDPAGAIQSRVLVLRDISDRIEIERENRRQARHVRLVHEVSAKVHEAETIEAGLEEALGLIGRTMELPLGHFLRSTLDPELGSRLVASGIVYCARDFALERELAGEPIRIGGKDSGIAGGDVLAFDPRGVRWWKDLGVDCVLSVPVMIGQELYGMFEFFAADSVGVEDSTTMMLEHVGELVGRAVERKLAEEKIRRLAFRDDLTGLPNRQRFHHILRGAIALAERSERRMALLFMDLDGFKKVNDTLGHEVGDLLLAEVAARFSRVVRVSDHVGRQDSETPESSVSRLGGDEFTVLLTEIHGPQGAALVAERLLSTLEAPIMLAGKELFMSTSIGIAVFPDDGDDADQLLRNADAAMYFAKGRGRNGFQFYSEEMNRTRSTQIEIESRLRGALERDEFRLYYQPILDSETGEIVAAEALLRWIDAEHGFVPPDEFVPVAEETGLIVPIGRWVFRTACAQAQAWHEGLGRKIRIGVNVSGHQIREPGMIDMVRLAIEETGVDPEQLEVELTESTIMQDDSVTEQTLRQLREIGIGLSLDDFGTGYSSLSYLRRFTIDRVKIDRTFVSELPENADDAALTSAIIAMAHGLRLKVVAEGVETASQAMFLRQRDCDELQGYLFGRPSPPEEFDDCLRARPLSLEEQLKDAEDQDEG